MSPTSQISEAAAAEIAGTVKAVAHALERTGTSNGYPRVYGELYRRYGISSSTALPQAQLAAALAWLRPWHEELTQSEPAAH